MPTILSRHSLYKRQSSRSTSSKRSFSNVSGFDYPIQQRRSSSRRSASSKSFMGDACHDDKVHSVPSLYMGGFHHLSQEHFPTPARKHGGSSHSFASNSERYRRSNTRDLIIWGEMSPLNYAFASSSTPPTESSSPEEEEEDGEWGHFIDVVEAEREIVQHSRILSARNLNSEALATMYHH